MAGKAAFAKGDRVAWHHAFATQHAAGSIIRTDAVPVLDKEHPLYGEPGTGQIGTIVGPTNEEGTYWEVQFEDKTGNMVLTEDEIVKVAGDESAE